MGIKKFVESILNNDSNEKKSFYLGKVTEENAKLVKEKTGLDVKDYNRTMAKGNLQQKQCINKNRQTRKPALFLTGELCKLNPNSERP